MSNVQRETKQMDKKNKGHYSLKVDCNQQRGEVLGLEAGELKRTQGKGRQPSQVHLQGRKNDIRFSDGKGGLPTSDEGSSLRSTGALLGRKCGVRPKVFVWSN